MKYEAMPQIRIEVEHMKHTLITQLGLYGSELGERLDEEINKAIIAYPWEQKVKDIVTEALDSHIKSYFSYGAGHHAISKVIDEGFKEILKNGRRKPENN